MNGELHISFPRAFLVGQERRGTFTRGATVNHYPCVIHTECDLLLEPAGLNGPDWLHPGKPNRLWTQTATTLYRL